MQTRGRGENSPKNSRMERLNHAGQDIVKTLRAFLPRRVGGVCGADGERVSPVHHETGSNAVAARSGSSRAASESTMVANERATLPSKTVLSPTVTFTG